MSIWDRIGDAWDGTKKGVSIGYSWTMAQLGEIPKMQQQVDQMIASGANSSDPVARSAASSLPTMQAVRSGTADAVGAVADAIDWTQYNAISRPVSTAATLAREGTLVRPNQWDDAWGKSKWLTAGESIASIWGPDTADDSPEERDKAFRNTASGKVQSGAIDFALGLFADPFKVAGKPLKALSVASRTVKSAEEASAVVKAAEAGTTAGRTGRLAEKMNSAIARTDGKTAAEIATMPEFASTPDASAIAYIFARANETVTDPAQLLDVKRTAWGAALGDKDSIARLKDLEGNLAEELRLMGSAPAEGRQIAGAVSPKWGPQRGQIAVKDDIAADGLMSYEAARTELENQIDHLNRLIDMRGQASLVQGSSAERALSNRQIARINQTVIDNGAVGTRIRLIGGAGDTRLPGNINVKDSVDGFGQFREHLSQARLLPGDQRRDLLNRFIQAPNQGARQDVVHDAERAIVESIGARYGLTSAGVKKIITTGEGIRSSHMGLLQGRVYSAAPEDKLVPFVDDETGEVMAISKPLMQSQLENAVPLVDPHMLEKAIRKSQSNKVWADRISRAGIDGTDFMNNVTTLQDASDVAFRNIMGAWKFGALFRAAYPLRIQADSQMRYGAHLGAMQYIMSIQSRAAGYGKYLLTNGEIPGNVSLKNLFKEGDYVAASSKMLKDAGVPEEFIAPTVAKIIDSNGTMADLMSEVADRGLAKARMSGDWSIVKPDNANWKSAYQRAVNQQLRNSPIGMMVVNGASDREIKAAIGKAGAARTEWRNLSASHADDIDDLLGKLRGHVDQLLPTQVMRDVVKGRTIRDSDMKKWFESTNKSPAGVPRMDVHGEAYSPIKVNPVAASYNATRKRWFELAGSAPENMLARVPLFANSFKRHLAEYGAKLGDDATAEELNNARVAAARMARRELGQVLYEASHTSNIAHAMPVISPFFAAWEDMMKKWGGLLYDSPWVLSRLENAWDAPNAMGIVQDSNGNRVDAEGVHWLKNPDGSWHKLDANNKDDAALIGDGEYVMLPASILGGLTGQKDFRINKKSFNITFQGEPWWLPGAGPMVQIPVNELVKNSFPEEADNPVIKYLLPYGATDDSPLKQALPGWVRQVGNSGLVGKSQDYYNVYAQLTAQEMSLQQAGKRGPIKDGEIATKTRNWFLMRALASNTMPVSMVPSAKLQFYVDQARIYRQKYNNIQSSDQYKQDLAKYENQYGKDLGEQKLKLEHPEYQSWQAKFYADYPDYYRMSLSLSSNESGIVATDKAYDALKDPKLKRAVAKNVEFGWAYVGADNVYGTDDGQQFSQSVYNYQLTNSVGEGNPATYRGKQSPDEALAAVDAAKGWVDYQKGRTWLNEQLANRGLASLNSKGAEDLKQAFNTFKDQLSEENHAWREDFDSRDSGKVLRFLTAMTEQQSTNKSFAARTDQQAIADYVKGRAWMQEQLAAREKHTLASNPDLEEQWDIFTSALVKDNIGFEQVYNRILDADDLKGDLYASTK